MIAFASFVSGVIFGLGLVVSGLINPAKVQNFLDIGGNWDPSLAITMAVAVAITVVGYKRAFGLGKPLLSESFQIPGSSAIDARLIGGAAIFGIGWGLAGFCPGPAIAAAALGVNSALIFVIAMIAGMVAARTLISRLAAAPNTRSARI